jgi:Kef-type K+ transport system membrane component KefB
VVAGLGLTAGAIDSEIYSIVVGMAIITTLVVPPLLPALVRRAEREAGSADEDEDGPPAGIEDDDGIETPLPG